jgi:transcription antitermination factor NusA-like protein
MNISELRTKAIDIIKTSPDIKSEIQDIYSLAMSEIEEEHECMLAYNDMLEIKRA